MHGGGARASYARARAAANAAAEFFADS